jgi:Zn-dependent protease with chaperone function
VQGCSATHSLVSNLRLAYRRPMTRLYVASLVTLSLLAAMVAGVVLAAMVALGEVDLGVALTLTLVINAVLFLVSPWLTDLMLRWVNGLKFLDDAEAKARHPHVHALIHDVAREFGFKAPSIGIIPDRNPTAFTYGLLRSNARIVLTDGIFEFLSEDETRAVIAHELGHIVHRDFLVMTIAGMLVQMLFQIYAGLIKTKSSNSKKGNGAAVIAITAFVLYQLGIYMLLYLSRTREYLADSFSAERIEARHLANALVKLAYGIAEAADSEATRGLLASTRHLGAVDVNSARYLGLVAENAKSRPGAIAEAMLFDCYNPWAKWVELTSTHPLTGRRILSLAAIASAKRQSFPDLDIEGTAKRAGVDRSKLAAQFRSEIAVVLLPWLAALAVAATGAIALAPAAAAVCWLATIPWRYPQGAAKSTTVAELMSDWAASPVRGRAVRLSGEPIGRADAGSAIGEDLIFADKTGRIVADFRSMLGPIGDLFAGWARVKKHIGSKGELVGWFRRGTGGYVILSRLATGQGTLSARPYFWEVVFALLIIGATAWLWFAMPEIRTLGSVQL